MLLAVRCGLFVGYWSLVVLICCLVFVICCFGVDCCVLCLMRWLLLSFGVCCCGGVSFVACCLCCVCFFGLLFVACVVDCCVSLFGVVCGLPFAGVARGLLFVVCRCSLPVGHCLLVVVWRLVFGV